jgi:hypothetical protein
LPDFNKNAELSLILNKYTRRAASEAKAGESAASEKWATRAKIPT